MKLVAKWAAELDLRKAYLLVGNLDFCKVVSTVGL